MNGWLTRPLTPEESSSIKVHSIDWGSYLVRGTDDIETAKRAVALTLREREHFDAVDIEEWFERHPNPEVRWWRCNPCTCGEEHRFDMAPADGPGRGNFRGAYFS